MRIADNQAKKLVHNDKSNNSSTTFAASQSQDQMFGRPNPGADLDCHPTGMRSRGLSR